MPEPEHLPRPLRGAGGGKCHSLQQTGRILYSLGLCSQPMNHESVRLIELRALAKIRKALAHDQ